MKNSEMSGGESCDGAGGNRSGKTAIPLASKRLLNEVEMEIYGMSRHTWRWLRVRGGGPEYLKIGRRVLYDREVVEAWLKGRKTSSTSQPAGVKPC